MPPVRVHALVKPEDRDFLTDYFSDTLSKVQDLDLSSSKPIPFSRGAALFFADVTLLTSRQSELLGRLVKGNDEACLFFLGHETAGNRGDVPNAAFLGHPLTVTAFETALFARLACPSVINVLVIDDEHEIGAGLKEYLESKKNPPAFRVDYALNGLEAHARMETFRPDVCVLDLKMPVKSGHDFFREARKRFPEFRAIILTSSVGPDEISEIRKMGSPPVVEKGSRRSTFQELAALIMKTRIFS